MSDTSFAAVIRALDDLHAEVEKASKSIDKDYAGPYKSADQRIHLIREYSMAVSRILDSYSGPS